MTARLCVILLALGVSTAAAVTDISGREVPPAADLLRLDGEEFNSQIKEVGIACVLEEECPYTAQELIGMAGRLVTHIARPEDRRRQDDDGAYSFWFIFKAACAKATANQVPALIEIYARIPPSAFEKSTMLPPLAAACLASEASQLRNQHAHVALDNADLAVPAKLQRASAGLHRAWRLYHRAVRAYRSAFPEREGEERIDATANQKAFYSLIEAALRGADDGAATLSKYADVGANCLNIRDVEDGVNIGTLLALLHGGKPEEAIGAALKVISGGGSTSSPEVFVRPLIGFFDSVGVEWETIFVGAMADSACEGWPQVNQALLDALASSGSERSVMLVLELTELAEPEQRGLYATAFDKWVQPDTPVQACNGKDVARWSRGHGGPREAPVTPAMQKAVLQTTRKLITPEVREDLATAALDVFSRSLSADSAPALRLLAEHDSPEVAQRAKELLCALGVALPVAESHAEPVRFRIILGGQPLPNGLSVIYMVQTPDSGQGGTAEVHDGGIIEIDRRRFAKARSVPVTVLFSSDRFETASQALMFHVSVPAPANFEEVTELQIEASPVEVRLANLRSLNGPAPDAVKINFSQLGDSESADTPSYSEPIEVSAREPIVFPLVQRGRYRLIVSAAGAAKWRGAVTVRPALPAVEVPLQPGSDLRFKLLTPNGQPWYGVRLWKDGKQMDDMFADRDATFHSLACGDYVVHIIGSTELASFREGKVVPGPDEAVFAGQDIPVSIHAGSPTVIDLGEIRLRPPEPAAR